MFQILPALTSNKHRTSQWENKRGIDKHNGREIISREMQKWCYQKGARERQKQTNKSGI